MVLTTSCTGGVEGWGVQGHLAKRFAAIANGDTKDQVLVALGTSARESTTFELPQREGYEALFAQSAESRASTFLYWDTGIDEVAVVGLNESGQVVFKCRAGT